MTVQYLQQRDVPWQASTSPPGVAGSVQFLGTTAPQAKSLGNPEWQADLEFVWRSRVTPVMRLMDDRARRLRRQAAEIEHLRVEYGRQDIALPSMVVKTLRSAEWHEHRSRALAMARADVLTSCGQRWRAVACGCGMREMKVGCDQPQLCVACRKKHARLWRRRITDGMNVALTAERSRWYRTPSTSRRGMCPGVYLITLTAPHTGDLATDRERMGKGVRKLLKHANKFGWWQTYALTWEATAGDDGKGHMHAHLAVISGWIPYRRKETEPGYDEDEMQRWDSESPNARPRPRKLTRRRYTSERGVHDVWRDAMPGALVVDIKPPRRDTDEAASSAHYLAKYVTKGVDAAEFTGRKAGELLVAFRTRRKVTTSAYFWVARDTACECCNEQFRSMGAPCSLQELLPGAVIRSKAERMRYWIPRGEPQVALRWSD